MRERPFHNARELVEQALDLDYFKPYEGTSTPIPARFAPGEGPLIVVVGPNAGGKSFFRRIVQGLCAVQSIECLHLSMEGRFGTMGGMRAFVYGNEEDQSTGYNSMNLVVSGIRNCRLRDRAHVIVWDEPDIGLSEGYAASVGRTLAQFAEERLEHTLAAVVITHRKALVAELAPAAPHYLHLGDLEGPTSLASWLAAPVVVRPLEELVEEQARRRQAIARILRKVGRKY